MYSLMGKIYFLFFFFWTWAFSQGLFDLPVDTERYFSPRNGSGRQSFLLDHRILDRSDIESWELLLIKPTEEGLKIIRKFKGEDYPDREVLWKGDYFIPTKNGRRWVSKTYDGLYFYTIKANTSEGEVLQSPFSSVVVDRNPPIIIAKSPSIFSPNGDGRLDLLPISLDISSYGKHDVIDLLITDSSDNLIKKHSLKGGDFKRSRHEVKWDGQGDDGKLVDSGEYFVQVKARDLANNFYQGKKQAFELVTRVDSIDLEASKNFFSYQSNDISFIINHSSPEGWQYEVLTVKNNQERVVLNHTNRRFANSLAISPTRRLPTGTYQSTLRAFYRSGNAPVSKEVSFAIYDHNKPFISLKRNVDLFVISSDPGVVNEIQFSQLIKSSVKTTSKGRIRVWKRNRTLGETLFEINFKQELPPQWTWKGELNPGKAFPDLENKLVYQVVSRDKSGETVTARTRPFTVLADPSQLTISPERDSISTSRGNYQDRLVFLISMSKLTRSRIQRGRLIISQDEETIITYPLTANTKKIIFKPKSLRNELGEGTYNYSYTLSLNAGETLRGEGLFYIDNTPITISANISVTQTPESLDEQDLNSLVVDINARKSSKFQPGDTLTLSIYNNQSTSASGGSSSTLIWNEVFTNRLPPVVEWNGKTRGRQTLTEGIYTFKMATKDRAGNKWNRKFSFEIRSRQ